MKKKLDKFVNKYCTMENIIIAIIIVIPLLLLWLWQPVIMNTIVFVIIGGLGFLFYNEDKTKRALLNSAPEGIAECICEILQMHYDEIGTLKPNGYQSLISSNPYIWKDGIPFMRISLFKHLDSGVMYMSEELIQICNQRIREYVLDGKLREVSPAIRENKIMIKVVDIFYDLDSEYIYMDIAILAYSGTEEYLDKYAKLNKHYQDKRSKKPNNQDRHF